MKLNNIEISKPISIWAGGESVDKLSDKDINYIRDNTFSVALNDFTRFTPDARFWVDYNITNEWEKYYTKYPKDTLFITRDKAFLTDREYKIKEKVDFWFDIKDIKFYNSKWTIWIAQVIFRTYYPMCPIIFFGFDCNNNIRKTLVDGEVVIKNNNGYDRVKEHYEIAMKKHPEYFINVWNCSMDSSVCIPKKHYKEII